MWCSAGKMVNIGQGLGWVMTVTYLGARVPQIFKNLRRGTTKGLSLFMFVLLVLGSITYVLSIFIRYAACSCLVIQKCSKTRLLLSWWQLQLYL